MSLPKNIKAQFLARFDELIKEGAAFVSTIQSRPPGNYGNVVMINTTYSWNAQRLEKWKHSHPTGFEKEGWSFSFAPATRQG